MSIKVAAWNIETRLSGHPGNSRGSSESIARHIRALDADVVVLPESHDMAQPTSKAMQSLGQDYNTIYSVSYEDAEPHPFGIVQSPGITVMSRLAIKSIDTLRPAGWRSLPRVLVENSATGERIRVYATHLDDREQATRRDQIDDYAAIMAEDPYEKVLMGDFNASSGTHPFDHLMTSPIAERAGRSLPTPHLRSLAQRATAMASGDDLRYLEKRTHLLNADLFRRATSTPKMRGFERILPSIPLFDLDHIYVSNRIVATDFTVSRDGGSDHRAISATLHL